jgi:hypothetical protein
MVLPFGIPGVKATSREYTRSVDRKSRSCDANTNSCDAWRGTLYPLLLTLSPLNTELSQFFAYLGNRYHTDLELTSCNSLI